MFYLSFSCWWGAYILLRASYIVLGGRSEGILETKETPKSLISGRPGQKLKHVCRSQKWFGASFKKCRRKVILRGESKHKRRASAKRMVARCRPYLCNISNHTLVSNHIWYKDVEKLIGQKCSPTLEQKLQHPPRKARSDFPRSGNTQKNCPDTCKYT